METAVIPTIAALRTVSLFQDKSYERQKILSIGTLPPPLPLDKADLPSRLQPRRVGKTDRFVIGARAPRGYTPANKNTDYLAFGDTMDP